MEEKHFNIIATAVIVIIALGIGVVMLNESAHEESATPPKITFAKPTTPKQELPETTLQYTNNDYGFNVSLPPDWKNFSLVMSRWEGIALGITDDALFASGPLISIRHPLWTKEAPRQDIPIMVFTVAQWDDLQSEHFHIGAAPIPPSELGRNANYVFALPARYNYAFLPGFEEVQSILESKPLHAF